MEAALSLVAEDHSTLLKQVPVNIGPCNTAVRREHDANELSKTTRVVVSLRLSIAKCFQDGISLEDLALQEAQAPLGCEC